MSHLQKLKAEAPPVVHGRIVSLLANSAFEESTKQCLDDHFLFAQEWASNKVRQAYYLRAVEEAQEAARTGNGAGKGAHVTAAGKKGKPPPDG
eukprot:g9591.t1